MKISSLKNTRSNPQLESGFSLVELMVALALSLLIVAALTQLFSNVTGSAREMAKTNTQIESARHAMQMLRRDIIHAGYWGSHVPEFDRLMFNDTVTDAPAIIPDPCLDFASWPDATTPGHIDALLGVPVQAYEGSPSTNCDTLLTGESALAGTDVLVVRHAETCAAGDTNCAPDAAGPLYFQASNCATELPPTGSTYYALDPNSYPLTERDCTTPAAKRRFVQNIYFIRNNADGVPSLYRSEYGGVASGTLGQLPAEELIPGVERFRVELGVDSLSETGAAVDYTAAVNWQDASVWTVATNRGDGIPDGPFIHCSAATPCNVGQFVNTTAIKVYLLVRADQPTLGYLDTKTYDLGGLSLAAFNDNFKRHVFSSTIRVNNVAARRETP